MGLQQKSSSEKELSKTEKTKSNYVELDYNQMENVWKRNEHVAPWTTSLPKHSVKPLAYLIVLRIDFHCTYLSATHRQM